MHSATGPRTIGIVVHCHAYSIISPIASGLVKVISARSFNNCVSLIQHEATVTASDQHAALAFCRVPSS